MNRSTLGSFGRDLPPDRLSQALAAVGVLVAADGAARPGADLAGRLAELIPVRRALVTWRLPRELSELASAEAASASALAAAWHDAVSSRFRLPRLLVELPGPSLVDPWLLQALATPQANLGALIFVAEPAEVEVGFSWPLRLGLLDDPRSTSLRGRIGAKPWMQELVEVTPVAEQPDVLFLPHGLRGALRAALGRAGRERADLAVVLGGVDGSPEAASGNLAALRGEIAAGGVAVVDVDPDAQPGFVEAFVANLSHDLAADEALFAAAAGMNLPPPLLVASRALAESTRISRFLSALIAELETFPPDQPLALDDDTKRSLGVEGARTGPELADALRARLAALQYPQESTTATWVTRVRRSAEALRRLPPRRMLGARAKMSAPPAAARGAAAPSPQPGDGARPRRHLQAEVFETNGAGELEVVRRALLPSAAYVLSFLIGRPGAGRAVAGVFDETKLPPSEAGHDLTVVFAETPPPGAVGAPQVGRLHLPPEGDSEPCTFAVRVPARATSFEGRVTVLFRNRVLETARLQARVSGSDPRGALELRLTSLEVDGVESAGRRPAVDGALVLNETGSGDHALTGVSGDVAVIASLAGVEKAVARLQSAIAQYTDLDRGAKGLPPKEMTKLLGAIAHPGRLLWDHLQKALPAPIRTATRLHLVEGAIGALLPVELFYRAPAPLPDATPCPGGPPDGDRPCCECPEGLDGRKVVCANQFWGLRTVFEREAHPIDVPSGAVAAVRSGGAPTSAVRLDSALLAVSELVDAEAKHAKPKERPSAVLQGALAELIGPGQLRTVETLAQWESAVEKGAPSLLVLVVHSTQDDLENEAIEIAGERISYANIEGPHLVAPGGPEPIVLLIGCSTAGPDAGALGLVPRLIAKRASAVVATLAPVLGRYAGPATAELLRALAASRRSGAGTLGDALLQVKRALVERGEPIGMALVAYGDASVQL